MVTEYTFFVAGKPEPQGSTRAFVRGGRAVVTSDNPANKGWRETVARAMSEHVAVKTELPVRLSVDFFLPAPKSLPKKRPIAHTTKPDGDKLLRSVFDAGTGVGWKDDAQVVSARFTKAYAIDGAIPGALIRIQFDEGESK